MPSPTPPDSNRTPIDRPPSGRGRRFPDRQDGRWALLGLIALALGAGLMVLRGQLLQPNRGGAATAPADPNRPTTGTR